MKVLNSLRIALGLLSSVALFDAVAADLSSDLRRRLEIIYERDPLLAKAVHQYADALARFSGAKSPDAARTGADAMGAAERCGSALVGSEAFAFESRAIFSLFVSDDGRRLAFDAASRVDAGRKANHSHATARGRSSCTFPIGQAAVKPLPRRWVGCAVETRYTVTKVNQIDVGRHEVFGRFEIDGRVKTAFVHTISPDDLRPPPFRTGDRRCRATD